MANINGWVRFSVTRVGRNNAAAHSVVKMIGVQIPTRRAVDGALVDSIDRGSEINSCDMVNVPE
jgi:hypothetical protein